MKDIFIILGLFFTANSLFSQNISGSWFWKYEITNNVKHTTEVVFSVDNTQINGNYCSVFYEGNKIDCQESESAYCITLTLLEPNVYEGTFQSFSHGGAGTIRVSYLSESNELAFEIISSQGVFYLPQNATFHR